MPMPMPGGPPRAGGGDRYDECLGDVVKALMQMINGDCGGTTICQLAVNCLVSALFDIMEEKMGICRALWENPPAMFACACALGMLASSLHMIIDALCDKIACDTNKAPQWCSILANSSAGCLSGIGAVIGCPPALCSAVIGGWEGYMEHQCDELGKSLH